MIALRIEVSGQYDGFITGSIRGFTTESYVMILSLVVSGPYDGFTTNGIRAILWLYLW